MDFNSIILTESFLFFLPPQIEFDRVLPALAGGEGTIMGGHYVSRRPVSPLYTATSRGFLH